MDAKKRGVVVKVILYKSQASQNYSASHFLINQPIPVWIDYKLAIAHKKIMIIDGKKLLPVHLILPKQHKTEMLKMY